MTTPLTLQLSQISGGVRPALRQTFSPTPILPVVLALMGAMGIVAAGLLGAGVINALISKQSTQAPVAAAGPKIDFAKVVVLVRPVTPDADAAAIAAQLGIPASALDPAFGVVRMSDDEQLRAVLVPADIAEQIKR